MAYTSKTIAHSKRQKGTNCNRCGCMGEYTYMDEQFIMSDPIDKKALLADRTCHCATCWFNGGCETVAERAQRIYYYEMLEEILEDFEPARAADLFIENKRRIKFYIDWADPEIQQVVKDTDSTLKIAVKSCTGINNFP